MRRALALAACLALSCNGAESIAPAADAPDETTEDTARVDATIDMGIRDTEAIDTAVSDSFVSDSFDAHDSADTFDATVTGDTWVCSEPDNGVSADADDAPDADVFRCGEIWCRVDEFCTTHRSEGDAWCPSWIYAECRPLDASCDGGATCDCATSATPLCSGGPFAGCSVVDGHVTVMCVF